MDLLVEVCSKWSCQAERKDEGQTFMDVARDDMQIVGLRKDAEKRGEEADLLWLL